MANKILVNGPINAMRLEGNVYGIKKIVYLFFDVHMSLSEQTQCVDPDSIDIVEYIINQITDSNKNVHIDFLFEQTKQRINNQLASSNMYINKYIVEVSKLFNDGYNKKNISNLRNHYIDIRDHTHVPLDIFLDTIYNIIQNSICNNFINENDNNNIINNIANIESHLKIVYNFMFTKNKMPKEFEKNQEIIELKHICDKIKNKYNHTENKNMLEVMMTQSKKIFEISFAIINSIKKEHNLFEKNVIRNYGQNKIMWKKHEFHEQMNFGTANIDYLNYLKKIYELYEGLNNNILNMFVIIMDIYAIRRIIDKDYITNIVVYTGASHSMNYVYMLVKYFDFEITHSSIKKHTFNDLKKKIKLLKFDDVSFKSKMYNIIIGDTFMQCSDLTIFPKKFE